MILSVRNDSERMENHSVKKINKGFQIRESKEALEGMVNQDYPTTSKIVRIFTSSTFTGAFFLHIVCISIC